MLTRTKIDISDEKRFLINLIVSDEFIKMIAPYVDVKLMESPLSRTVASWVMEFYEKMKCSPQLNMPEIYLKKAKYITDENLSDMIYTFLTHLSSEYEKYKIHNVEYTVRNAMEYLRTRSLASLIERMTAAVAKGKVDEAEHMVTKYSRLEKKQSGEIVHIFRDSEIIANALTFKNNHLFRMQGDLGISIGWINRSDFVAFSAPPKRGKTWYMMEAGLTAAQSGCRVLFISLEMDRDQTVRRWWSSLNAQGIEEGTFDIPFFQGDGDSFDVLYKQEFVPGLRKEKEQIDVDQATLSCTMGEGDIRLLIYPSGETTLTQIEEELENLEHYENYVPDVVIIDYADILKAERGGDKRFQLDDIWVRMRGLAQKRNIAVITGSQTGRATTKKDAGADDVAEHFGKIAHITKGIFINQTKEEKKAGLVRLECETQREGKSYTDQVLVLQQLDIGRPYLDSKFINKVNLPNRGNGYGV